MSRVTTTLGATAAVRYAADSHDDVKSALIGAIGEIAERAEAQGVIPQWVSLEISTDLDESASFIQPYPTAYYSITVPAHPA